ALSGPLVDGAGATPRASVGSATAARRRPARRDRASDSNRHRRARSKAASEGGSGSEGTGVSGGGSTPVTTIHVKIVEHRTLLTVNLIGEGEQKVLVVYIATYHGKTLQSGERVVTLVKGRRTTSFQLSRHTVEYATVSVKARLLEG
ncbi:MAG: hypothetical protein ACYCU0_15975, partial [Solirubrobacteraceae bacterium]